MDVYTTNSGLFFNSKCLFVEYIDIIKSPYFTLSWTISTSTENIFQRPVCCEKLKGVSVDNLVDWYYKRKYQNILLALVDELTPDISVDDLDRLLDLQIKKSPILLEVSPTLNCADALIRLCLLNDASLLPEIRVYYPFENDSIRKDIQNIFSGIFVPHNGKKWKYPDISFVYGDIAEAFKDMPEDSTYFFSEVSNINILEEVGKLDYSSIVIPSDYAYNYNDDGEYLVDIEQLSSEHNFKFFTFSATTKTEYVDDDE